MERVRMVGDFELVYEPDMKMFRIMKKETEEFSKWFSPEEAEELKSLDEDDFFATAEQSVQNSRDTNREESGGEISG